MQKDKEYINVKFTPEVLDKATSLLKQLGEKVDKANWREQ